MNQMRGIVRVQIFDGNDWRDVTNRKVIIYGAGQGCIDMLNILQLPNVEYIVDGNSSIQGNTVLVENRKVQIHAPEIIKSLDVSRYFVAISSIKFEKEIRDNLQRIIDTDIPICIWHTGIRYCYNTVEDMLLMDPTINRKLEFLKLSFYVYWIIEKYRFIEKQYFSEHKINSFIPIQEGESKLLFLFGNERQLWVFSCRGFENTFDLHEINKRDCDLIRKRYEFQAKRNYEGGLTIYEDESGVMVQYYAERVLDFSELDIRKKVIEKMRALHNEIPGELEVYHFEDEFYFSWQKKVSNQYGMSTELLKQMKSIGEECIKNIADQKENRVIHGDLTIDNVVQFHNDICFIDWEFLSIGDPMMDLSYFLYSSLMKRFMHGELYFSELCQHCYEELPGLLILYYEDTAICDLILRKTISIISVYIIRKIYGDYYADAAIGEREIAEFVEIYKTHMGN